MKNSRYWANRMRILAEALLDIGYEYIRNLEHQYDLAIQDVEAKISTWYHRFANNNRITLAEARRRLTTRELEEFRWTVEEYIKYGLENSVSHAWMKQLENASARVHISRMESLKLQLQQQAEILFGNQLDEIDQLIYKTYSEGYYRTAFAVQSGIGVGWSFHGITDTTIRKVLARPWTLDSQTFSDRIWANKQGLINSVNTQLTQMMMRGSAPDQAIKAIADRFKVSKLQAGRLVMTESAAFANEARKDCLKELGVENYVLVEALDGETCSLCRQLDGKVYPLSEYQTGLTAPPFHPWCRGTTAPYFEDLKGIGSRIARSNDGNTYRVPKEMTYQEWYKKYVSQSEETRYNIFKQAVHEEIRKDYPLKLNEGAQNKHIRGTNNFDPARSELTADPNELIKLYAGKSTPRQTNTEAWNHKEFFIHTSKIGIWRDQKGHEAPTAAGMIHYSKKKGLHIVPAQPKEEDER